METKPLIVIVGPTASGKSSLAINIAKRCGGEIICADSRTVYKGLDIGTAKPTMKEQDGVPHWGLDLVEPNEKFSAADFKKYADDKIGEIRARGNTPMLVGGTGLYIDCVIFDYKFGKMSNIQQRAELEGMSLDELYNYCKTYNIELPENIKNKRYVIRTIERNGEPIRGRRSVINNCYVVGIATDNSELRERISIRAQHIFSDDILTEAKKAGDKYGWNIESMTGNIYPLCYSYLNGHMTLDEIKTKFITLDWRLAKRQITWFKRNAEIRWLSLSDARNYLLSILATEH